VSLPGAILQTMGSAVLEHNCNLFESMPVSDIFKHGHFFYELVRDLLLTAINPVIVSMTASEIRPHPLQVKL
jgi:hypothetical protein